ncbi:retron system putative HNH endonuclease [Leeuwenhoekiella parthenopeia]|uniref:TIGR02646 family protein n=1 Tax=Leeuwenhoekiella parthenopeia TaxID=2890320 RepID=A0ABS8GPT5_9FLAO|nr:retron system putative HNH endonuclease [Leeuwenhoekiella parthenopeia]MCC4211297.1 TIGR02646 family protein [Leeuwenhoekiella parthenopeia]
MIKIKKNLEEVPISLIPAFNDLFLKTGQIPQTTFTTHQKRMDIIKNKTYNDKYSERYKLDDVRDSLIAIYKYKCAYCEQKMERYNVEHYRPKKIYYWLAFSWDNLIMACPTCNGYKGTHFDLPIGNTRISFKNTEANIRLINLSSSKYDAIEKPKLVNPEVTDPSGLIRFQISGRIESQDERFKYTIAKCQIDRKYLNDDRRKILNVFKRDICSAMLISDSNERLLCIKMIVSKFINDSRDEELPFLAFRRFAIENMWLNNFIKEMN